MLKSVFIEDIFIDFCDLVSQRSVMVQPQDSSAIMSFHRALTQGSGVTQNQANYMIKILQKYKNQAKSLGYDYVAALELPQWKNNFRVLDLSRKIFAELDDNNKLWICLKFPFQLKKEFEEEILKTASIFTHTWNSERKIKMLSAYDFNLVQIYDFVTKHNFSVDETFLSVLAEVEEIWQNSETILPKCEIIDGQVVLLNSNESADMYWEKHLTGNINNDLILAKSMGFVLNTKPTNTVEKIANSKENLFWMKTHTEFLELCKNISGRACIILDRASESLPWLVSFAESIDQMGIDRSTVKVGFRADKGEGSEINAWIKENNFGGSVETGKILIFKHKPPKWLFREENTVTILATNTLYQSNSSITRDWVNSHPCVIYLGDIKPTQYKEREIVEL